MRWLRKERTSSSMGVIPGNGPSGRLGRDFVDDIAKAANGADRDAGRFDLSAEAVDVYLDGIAAGFFGITVKSFQELILAHDPADARHQRLQHAQLAGGEVERFAIDGHAPPNAVECQRAKGEHRVGAALAAP